MDGLRIMDILTSYDFDYDVQKYDNYFEIIINCQSAANLNNDGMYRGRNDKDKYNILPVIIISFTHEGKYLSYDFTQIIEKIEENEEVEIPEEIE